MPTYNRTARFVHEYRRLTDDQRAAFRAALREFISMLQEWEAKEMSGRPSFPARLRVKSFRVAEGLWELSWAGDGRCLWRFDEPVRPGFCHVVWERIGSHSIFEHA